MAATATTPARPRRVFIGVHEIANMIATMAAALREEGIPVDTLVIDWPSNPFYADNEYDDRVRAPTMAWRDRARFRAQMIGRLLRALRRCDTFVFVWKFSFLPAQLDLALLRLLRRRVVVFYCGDDIRYRPIQVEIDRMLLPEGPEPYAEPEERAAYLSAGRGFWGALWSTKLAEKAGCRIVSTRDAATFQGRPYYDFHFAQRRLADGPRQASGEPLVVHAPSDSVVKGTKHVREAVERLRSEGLPFRFELIRGLSNAEVLARLREAEIAVDQPGTWVARFSAEALASGCAVIGGNRAAYHGRRDDSPVIQFEADSAALADALRELVSDAERRQRLMEASYEYWRRAYSHEVFADWFLRLLDGSAERFPPLPGHRSLVRRHTSGPLRKAALTVLW